MILRALSPKSHMPVFSTFEALGSRPTGIRPRLCDSLGQAAQMRKADVPCALERLVDVGWIVRKSVCSGVGMSLGKHKSGCSRTTEFFSSTSPEADTSLTIHHYSNLLEWVRAEKSPKGCLNADKVLVLEQELARLSQVGTDNQLSGSETVSERMQAALRAGAVSFGVVSFWRGIWVLWDCATPVDHALAGGIASLCTGLGVLLASRAFHWALAPPLPKLIHAKPRHLKKTGGK